MDLLETLFKKIFFCFSDSEDHHSISTSSLSIPTDSTLSAPVPPCQYPNSQLGTTPRRHPRARRRPMPPQPTSRYASPYGFRRVPRLQTSNSSNQSEFSAPIDDPALRFLTQSLIPLAYHNIATAAGPATSSVTSSRTTSVRSRNTHSRTTNSPLRHGHGVADVKADTFSGFGNIRVTGVGQGGSFPRSTALPRYPSVNRKMHMGVPRQGTRTHIGDVDYESCDNYSDYGMGFVGRNCRIA